MQMKAITELPPLDDSVRNGGSRGGFSRGMNGSTRGSSYAGNRSSERSSKKNYSSFAFFYLVHLYFRCLF